MSEFLNGTFSSFESIMIDLIRYNQVRMEIFYFHLNCTRDVVSSNLKYTFLLLPIHHRYFYPIHKMKKRSSSRFFSIFLFPPTRKKKKKKKKKREASIRTHRRIDPRLSHFCNLNLPLISFPSIISPPSFLPPTFDASAPSPLSPLFSLELNELSRLQVKFSIGTAIVEQVSNDTRAEN